MHIWKSHNTLTFPCELRLNLR